MTDLTLTITGDTPTGVTLDSIVRVDTGANILSEPVDMTQDEDVWSYSFDSPAGGINYTYAYTITWDDNTTYSGNGILLVPDGDQPVDTSDVQRHLRITNAEAASNYSYLALLISAATDYAEARLGWTLMARSRTVIFNTGDDFVIRNGPLLEIQSVTDGKSNAITGYTIERFPLIDRLSITASFTLPVTVVYTAGHLSPSEIPASIKLAILQHVGSMYEARESTTDRPREAIPHSLDDFYRLKSRSVGIA